MTINGIITRRPPEPWEGAGKIPWNDPAFSERMLQNHLSQDHDWASRRKSIIEAHIAWVDAALQSPSRILDLACGPGLYVHALAERGHACTGVDFSPASVAYARKRAAGTELCLEYILEDIRTYTSAAPFDCVLLTFGECNVFSRDDFTAIIDNCAAMLHAGGLFVLEAHTFDAVREAGTAPASWSSHASGLFSPKPHLLLQENFWNEASRAATARYYVVDAATAKAEAYTASMQAYTDAEYKAVLAPFSECRLTPVGEWPPGEAFTDKLQTFACRK